MKKRETKSARPAGKPIKIVGTMEFRESECIARLRKGKVTQKDILQALADHIAVNADSGDAWHLWQNACLSRAITLISGGKAVAA